MLHDLLIAALISAAVGAIGGFLYGLPSAIRDWRKISAEADAVIAAIRADSERLQNAIAAARKERE